MNKQDTLIITSPQTNFEEIEFIRKNALLDWIRQQLSFKQGFNDSEAEYGYKNALKELMNFLDTLEVKEVDLEKELSNYIEHYRNRETGYTLFGIAKYFYELGLKAQKGE